MDAEVKGKKASKQSLFSKEEEEKENKLKEYVHDAHTKSFMAYFYSAWIGWTVTELFLHQ